MVSKVKVDAIESTTGSGTIALNNQLSGMTVASMPTGSVIQVLSNSTTSNYSSTSAGTVLTVGTFTPISSSNKIIYSFSARSFHTNDPFAQYVGIHDGSGWLNGTANSDLRGWGVEVGDGSCTRAPCTFIGAVSAWSGSKSLVLRAEGQGGTNTSIITAPIHVVVMEIKG